MYIQLERKNKSKNKSQDVLAQKKLVDLPVSDEDKILKGPIVPFYESEYCVKPVKILGLHAHCPEGGQFGRTADFFKGNLLTELVKERTLTSRHLTLR